MKLKVTAQNGATLADVLQGASVEDALVVSQQYENSTKTGAYPTAYSTAYDEAAGEHIIALTGLTLPSLASE